MKAAAHEVKAVLFDYGHTLVYFPYAKRTRLTALHGIQRVLSQLGVSVDVERIHQVVEHYAHRPEVMAIEDEFHGILADLGVSSCTPSDLHSVIECYSRPWISGPRIRGGAKDLLQGLKKMGLKTGIVGNIWSGWMDPVLVKVGIDHLLDVKVASLDVGFRKPDPQIFQLALDRLGVNPREAMMVGDGPNTDIQGAHELGMVTVRLLRGPRRMQPDKVQPDMKIRDFKALWSVLRQDD